MASIASWQLRPGRNPYERGSNRASHSGSSALRTRPCWARSAITGIPSPRSFPLAFGIHTRLTGRACQGLDDSCSVVASSALAKEVSATSPSIPAVLRPALRCVACRTLTSVLARLRSISFCKLRTFFRSPSRVALKILCRSRRTVSSWARQSMASQSRRASSGPFTPRSAIATARAKAVICVQLALRFRRFDIERQRLTWSTSAPLRVRASARIRPVMRKDRRRSRLVPPGFLLPFGCRHWLLGPSCSHWGVGPSSRSAYRTPSASGPQPGLPRSTRVRHDRGGRPLYPETVVLSRLGPDPLRHLPLPSSQSSFPATASHLAGMTVTRLHRGFTHVRPSGLLLACSPRMERETLGPHPDASHPAVTRDARQGRRQALSTGLELHLRHRRTSVDVFTHTVRPRVAPGPPPHPTPSTDDAPIPPTQVDPRQRERCGMVPVFTANRSISLASSFAPAASPRLRRRPSPWPPHRHAKPATESNVHRGRSRTAPRPLSTRFEPVPRLRSFCRRRVNTD